MGVGETGVRQNGSKAKWHQSMPVCGRFFIQMKGLSCKAEVEQLKL